jgi:hypothetical protein
VPPTRRRILIWIAAAGGSVLVLLVAAALVWLPTGDQLRRRVEAVLSDYFGTGVEFRELRVSFVPELAVEGAGLRLAGRDPASPPLITAARFRASASWHDVFVRPRRIRRLEVQQLRVSITKGSDERPGRDSEHGGCQGTREHPSQARSRDDIAPSPVVIDVFEAPGSEIVLYPRNPNKLPRRFLIQELTVRHLRLDEPLHFDAVLTNPTPTGQIRARGQFGPWVKQDPGLGPVSGTYRFERANLDTIDGLGGVLESTGTFSGVLEQILVKGETHTPDFSLDTGRHPMVLDSRFTACVDGTDGDTYLDRVSARLASTPIEAHGKIEGHVGERGRTVSLDATIENGRIEDLLQLAVKGGPPLMKGAVALRTRLLLPPGKTDVIMRLQLEGEFGLRRTRFTGRSVQEKIDEFSRRSRGAPGDDGATNVASNLRGRFRLRQSVLSLSSFEFEVPGGRVRMHGTYGLVSERIDFEGTARLDAKVSQMTRGFKSLLLKMVDPLFSRKDAGTVLPIHISGTREHPNFGVDMKGALTRKAK